jgi:hypothetical protein
MILFFFVSLLPFLTYLCWLLFFFPLYSITRLLDYPPLPRRILLSLGLIFLVLFPWNSGLRSRIYGTRIRFPPRPVHTTPVPRPSSVLSQWHRREKSSISHQASVTRHQAPGSRAHIPPWIPGIRHLRPPHPLWLVSLGAPGLHLAITTLGPGGATALVLNDHTVSLDQAFQVDPFSLSNHPREASDLFYLPVHSLRHWSWPSHASPQPYTTHPQ